MKGILATPHHKQKGAVPSPFFMADAFVEFHRRLGNQVFKAKPSSGSVEDAAACLSWDALKAMAMRERRGI
eukprot:3817500-Alexandrium_andersonii.AAC.1